MKRNLHLRILWVCIALVACLGIGLSATARAQVGDSFDVLGPGSTLKVAPDGLIRWTMDAENELSRMVAEKGVKVRSAKFDLDGNKLTYNAKTNHIYAYGSPLRIKQNEIDAVCRKFTYDVTAGKLLLEGDPVIQQKVRGKDGKMTNGPKISGVKITIIQKKDGTSELIVDAGAVDGGGTEEKKTPEGSRKKRSPRRPGGKPAELEVDLNMIDGGSKTPVPSPTPGKGPERIDKRRPGRIPEPALDEGGA